MDKKRIRKIIIVTVGIVLLAISLSCVGITAQNKLETHPVKKQSESATGYADFTKRNWGGDKSTILMKGHVEFTHDDTVLTSDEVTYNDDTKIAVSPGKLNINNPECTITGDKGTAYFRKKLGVIDGNVVMVMKPKKTDNEKTDKDSIHAKMKEETTITCPKLEYQYKNKIATASGGVHFKQAKRSANAQKAIYDQNKEILVLTGDVKGTDEYNQTFSAPEVKISLKKGDEWMEAVNASASFKIDLEEDNKQEDKQPEKPK